MAIYLIIISAIIALVIAILDSTEKKRKTVKIIVAIVATIVTIFAGIKDFNDKKSYQNKYTASQDTLRSKTDTIKIQQDSLEKQADSLTRQNEKIRKYAEREFGKIEDTSRTIISLQNKLINKSDSLNFFQNNLFNEITGGISYPKIYLENMGDNICNLFFVTIGKYSLYDINIYFQDPFKIEALHLGFRLHLSAIEKQQIIDSTFINTPSFNFPPFQKKKNFQF